MFTETETTIRIHSSPNPKGATTYRFWDVDRAIPEPGPKAIVTAQIFLEGRWQEMHFNRVWGQAYDPDRVGTWLKQKASRNFWALTGDRTCRVRYSVLSFG